MRNGRWLAIPVFFLALAACGGNSGGGDGGNNLNPTPVDHPLRQGQAATFAAGGFSGFEFLLPSQATVNFSASETTTDTWDVGIFTAAEWVSFQGGSGNQATTGIHNNVMQVSDSVMVPAGDWFLGFKCLNLIESCMLVFNIDAIY